MKKNTKVRHKKHGEGFVVSQSGRFLFIKYEGYKRPIKQSIIQIGVNIEILREIDVKNKIQQNNDRKDLNNDKKDLNNEKKKSDDRLSNKQIEKELKKLRRQFMNRNHHYELEGFVSEETILRRIKELENMLLTNKE